MMHPIVLTTPLFGEVLLVLMIALIVVVAAGLVRAVAGPSLEDRMLSVQLLGTGGVAVLLMLATYFNQPALLDVALLLALLASVTVMALTRREVPHD